VSTKRHPPEKHHCQNLADLAPLIEQLGHKNSGANWEDESHAYAFSVEGNAAAFGHPCATVHLDKRTGWLTVSSN